LELGHNKWAALFCFNQHEKKSDQGDLNPGLQGGKGRSYH
jgi:hypothetical protein